MIILKRYTKKINESIFEIFNNAVIHGDCKNIFSCGQYYPNKKRLDFTIVDLGKTIRANVGRYFKEKCAWQRFYQMGCNFGQYNKTRTNTRRTWVKLDQGIFREE